MSTIFRCTARTALRSIKTSPPFTQFTRAMSASLAGKSEWLVLIPDHEGVLKKRMEVRPYVSPLLEPPLLEARPERRLMP